MADAWTQHFRGLLTEISGRASATHGYSSRVVEAAEARLGVRLPAPLRAYYLSVGRHPLNRVHNRLWPPDEWEVARGRLVFMEENQSVVFWGVPNRSRAADPMVYQTSDLEDDDWYAEARCSRFLAATMCWQAVGGGLPHGGLAEPIPWTKARRVMRGWRSVGCINDLSAFVQAGRVVCLLRDGETALMHLATRSRRALKALESQLGVAIDEL